MRQVKFTLFLALIAFFFSAPQAYATNPISPEAISMTENAMDANMNKEGNVFQRFLQKTKAKFMVAVKKVKTAFSTAARSAKSYLLLWLVLGLVGFLLSVLGGGTFLTYASIAAYIASAVFFVFWIIALVG